jgi:hypothetical protein
VLADGVPLNDPFGSWVAARVADPLAGFAVVDLALRRTLAAGVDAFFSAEDLFDAEVEVARTPSRVLGAPRTLRAGLTLLRVPRP